MSTTTRLIEDCEEELMVLTLSNPGKLDHVTQSMRDALTDAFTGSTRTPGAGDHPHRSRRVIFRPVPTCKDGERRRAPDWRWRRPRIMSSRPRRRNYVAPSRRWIHSRLGSDVQPAAGVSVVPKRNSSLRSPTPSMGAGQSTWDWSMRRLRRGTHWGGRVQSHFATARPPLAFELMKSAFSRDLEAMIRAEIDLQPYAVVVRRS